MLVFILFFIWKQIPQPLPDQAIPEPQVKLYLHEQNELISLQLEDYIVGTVAAEMPASFDMEALKAQAVAARTYTLKKLIEKHVYPQGADLSDDINSCQAFRDVFSASPINRMEKENLARVKKAVTSTRGEVMLYQSQPIDALYHSTCGGQTETAANKIPYLQSVRCTYCRESPHYDEVTRYKNECINALVGEQGKHLEIKIRSTSPSGRLNQISINGKNIYASELRRNLNLPSQWISFSIDKRETAICTRGYGHGLGLCQYGADGMAKSGKNYHQILKHYYQGIGFYKIPY